MIVYSICHRNICLLSIIYINSNLNRTINNGQKTTKQIIFTSNSMIFLNFLFDLYIVDCCILVVMSKLSNLIKWVKKGDRQKIQQILQSEKLNLNEKDPKTGYGLLHIAVQNSDLDTFELLASQPGINLQLTTNQDQTPLDMAVRLNDITLVNHLLGLNVNARRRNVQNETVLHTALRNPTSQDILKRLFSKFFDINQRIQHYGCYLNLAIQAQQSDNFFYLIKDIGLNYAISDQEQNTSLILAVKKNQGDFVVAILQKLNQDKLLTAMEKQFFINAQNKQGNTALHEACIKDYQTITQKLQTIGAQMGIDPTIRNKKGQNIQAIKAHIQKLRLGEIQLQKKRKQQRVVRKKQKQQEKIREREQQERQTIEQKRRKKQEEKNIAIENQVKSQTQKQKILWGGGILLVAALTAMYLFFVNAIQKKKAMAL